MLYTRWYIATIYMFVYEMSCSPLTPLFLHNKLIVPADGEEWMDCSTLARHFEKLENEEFDTACVASIHVIRFNVYDKTYTLYCVDGAGYGSEVNGISVDSFHDWLSTSTSHRVQDNYPTRRECIEFFISILCLAILLGIVIRNT